jgi:hypothetical protein
VWNGPAIAGSKCQGVVVDYNATLAGSRSTKQITIVRLDLAKQVFNVHGAESGGEPVLARKLRRADVLKFFEKLPPCPVGMEACGGAHCWAREIAVLGLEVRLMRPAYVKPFVKRGKTDAADAEAVMRETSGGRHVNPRTSARSDFSRSPRLNGCATGGDDMDGGGYGLDIQTPTLVVRE